MHVSNVGGHSQLPPPAYMVAYETDMKKRKLCSANNQHVGVDFKAPAIIMMDPFCNCSYVSKMLQGKKFLLMESSCLLVLYLQCVIIVVLECNHQDVQSVFPCRYLLEECGPSLAGFPQRADGCVSQLRHCAEFFRKEVLQAFGCRSECGC